MTTLETLDLSPGPNTGLGDPLRDGGSKINNNFDKIFVLARVLQENTLQVNKAIGNADINILEIGDIVSGWFTSTLFLTHAVYSGGTVGDIGNYDVLGSYDFS